MYAEKLNRTYYDEAIIEDKNGDPAYEIISIVTVKKLKELSENPKTIEVKISIENNGMSTQTRMIEEFEREKKKPKILSEITLNPSNKITEEEVMMINTQPVTPEVRQSLVEKIKTWRKNSSDEQKEDFLLIQPEENQNDEPKSHEEEKVTDKGINQDEHQSPAEIDPQPSTSGVNCKALRRDSESLGEAP